MNKVQVFTHFMCFFSRMVKFGNSVFYLFNRLVTNSAVRFCSAIWTISKKSNLVLVQKNWQHCLEEQSTITEEFHGCHSKKIISGFWLFYSDNELNGKSIIFNEQVNAFRNKYECLHTLAVFKITHNGLFLLLEYLFLGMTLKIISPILVLTCGKRLKLRCIYVTDSM